MNKKTTWDMGRLMDLATGYWQSAALSAGVELNLFDALADHEATAGALADTLGASPHYLTELLDALAAIELLAKTGDTYRIAPEARPLLSPNSATCMLDALRFNTDLYALWGRIPEAVRQGRPALSPGAHLGTDSDRTRRFVMGMHSRAMGVAPALLPSLDPVGAHTLLDMAAGPGTFSRLLAEQHPELQVIQFDLPPVLEVARTLTPADHPAANRITFRTGDYHRDPLPGPVDWILLCGAIHQEDEQSVPALFRSVRAALTPGGRFSIVDLMLNANRTGPLFSNLFSINMMLTSPKGRVHEAKQLESWLYEAEFKSLETVRPAHSPYWIIHAR